MSRNGYINVAQLFKLSSTDSQADFAQTHMT